MQKRTHPRSSGIKTGYWSPNKKDELVAALAAYENTELTPQEIYELKAGTILKVIGNQWIPVDERLPETNDCVLMSFENFPFRWLGDMRAMRIEEEHGIWETVMRKIHA